MRDVALETPFRRFVVRGFGQGHRATAGLIWNTIRSADTHSLASRV